MNKTPIVERPFLQPGGYRPELTVCQYEGAKCEPRIYPSDAVPEDPTYPNGEVLGRF